MNKSMVLRWFDCTACVVALAGIAFDYMSEKAFYAFMVYCMIRLLFNIGEKK